MKRDDIKKIFPEATNDQITAILNQNNSEVFAERGKAESFRADALKIGELEKKLTEAKEAARRNGDLQKQNADEVRERQTAIEAASARVEELEKQIYGMKTELDRAKTLKSLADIGVTGEYAEKLYNEDGSFNFDTLGKILAEKEAAAAMRKEQRIASHSTNPTSGGSCLDDVGSHVPYDTEAGRRMKFGGNKDAMEVREYYESKIRY